jgi:5-methylthioribose kinase
VSNRVVRVERARGEAWVLKQALSKLRVPVDWFSPPTRVHREAAALRWLARALPNGAVPRFLFEDPEHHVLAMEAVPAPHENWKDILLAGRLDRAHIERFGWLLGTIHRRGHELSADVASEFGDTSYFASLRLEPYYLFTAEQVPEAAEFLRSLALSVRSNRITFVHGDYSPKNVLVRQDSLVLLDHEVAHFGDAAFDLGFSLTHLLSKAHHVRHLRSEFAESARRYWAAYVGAIRAGEWAHGLEQRAVRHTLGCLLGRVAGRSPLEYLSAEERSRQQRAILALIDRCPSTVNELVHDFTVRISSDADG